MGETEIIVDNGLISFEIKLWKTNKANMRYEIKYGYVLEISYHGAVNCLYEHLLYLPALV